MQTGVVAFGQSHGLLCGEETSLVVADNGVGVGRHVAIAPLLFGGGGAFGNAGFVLAVGNNRLACRCKKTFKGFVVVYKHIARGRAHKEFYGRVFTCVYGVYLVDIVVGGAKHKTEIHYRFLLGHTNFVVEGGKGSGLRLGVGHVYHGSNAPGHGGAALGVEVGFVGEARVAEMHMGVDNAGQQVLATRVDDNNALGGGYFVGNFGNAAVFHQHRFLFGVAFVHHKSVFDKVAESGDAQQIGGNCRVLGVNLVVFY